MPARKWNSIAGASVLGATIGASLILLNPQILLAPSFGDDVAFQFIRGLRGEQLGIDYSFGFLFWFLLWICSVPIFAGAGATLAFLIARILLVILSRKRRTIDDAG